MKTIPKSLFVLLLTGLFLACPAYSQMDHSKPDAVQDLEMFLNFPEIEAGLPGEHFIQQTLPEELQKFHLQFETPDKQNVATYNSVVDSAEYLREGVAYKEYYSYNDSGYLLKSLVKKMDDTGLQYNNEELFTDSLNDNNDSVCQLWQYWNNTTEMWVNNNRNCSSYNELGDFIKHTREIWDSTNAQWLVSEEITFSINQGQGMTAVYQRFDPATGQLVLGQRETRYISADGLTSITTYEVWDNSNQWVYDRRLTQTSNEDTTLLTLTRENWNAELNEWENDCRMTQEISESEHYKKSLQEIWDNSQNCWINKLQVYTNLNELGLRISEVREEWDLTGDQWDSIAKTEYKYDAFRNCIDIEGLIFDQKTEQWVETYNSIMTYDPNNNMLSELKRMWNSTAETWENINRKTFAYDTFSNLTHACKEIWVDEAWAPQTANYSFLDGHGNFFRYSCDALYVYYTTTETGIAGESGITIAGYSLSPNYPNPFNPVTTIGYSIGGPASGQDQPVRLEVFDVLGRKVATLVNSKQPAGEYKITFNAADLPSGIYYLQMQAGDFQQSRKMTLLK